LLFLPEYSCSFLAPDCSDFLPELPKTNQMMAILAPDCCRMAARYSPALSRMASPSPRKTDQMGAGLASPARDQLVG
jgi:hypothetical protein